MTRKKSLVGRFFSGIGAVFDALRRLFFLLFLLLALGVAWLAWRGGPPIKVDDGIALVVAPFGQIVERGDIDPRARILGDLLGEDPSQTVLADLVDAIDAAAEDSRIKLLFLKLDTGFIAGSGQLRELVDAIERFQQSDKPVYAYAPGMGQREYFLAAAADRVYLDPLGMVFLPGFESYPLYFAEALDSLGVTVNVFRVGEFKSAVEPFTRNSMSASARENAQRWLDSLWLDWRRSVAAGRGLEPDALQAYADNYVDKLAGQDGDTAQLARAAGLVDEVVPLQTMREQVGELVGMDEEHGSFRQIDNYRYLRAVQRENGRGEQAREEPAEDRISVVVVQGEIVDGFSAPGFAGGDSVVELIDRARRDERSAALILRVESPGGSVFASEQIRRALQRYRDSGRPAVVSMASVAASGGYWIAMDADRILAYPTTLTGSIGVFGLVPTFEGSLDKLGIGSDGVGTTSWSGGLSTLRPLSQQARDALQMMVETDYRRFIQRVAEARGLPVEAVDAIAQGQVWTGRDALERGLVDALGGLQDAVDVAAELAELDAYELHQVVPPMDFRLQLFDRFSSAFGPLPGPAADWLDAVVDRVGREARRWSDRRGVYAHCLCTPTGR